MTRRSRNRLLALLLGGLLAAEGTHAAVRLRGIASRAREEALAELREALGGHAVRLERDLAAGKDHARYLAGLPALRALLGAQPRDAVDAAGRDVSLFLLHFPAFGSVVLFDAAGNERLRAERLGSGVAVVPPTLLREAGDALGPVPSPPIGPGEVLVSPLAFDASRVDVADRDRQVLRYTTLVEGAAAEVGTLVLSLYAAPILDSLRRTELLPGGTTFLVDDRGTYLAHADRSREAGPGGKGERALARDHPRAHDALIRDGATAARDGSDAFVAARTGPRAPSGAPAWLLVAHAPADALARWSGTRRREASAAVLVFLATASVTGALGLALRRLARGEERLERERVAERRLAETERLATLGRLTAGVAHEINNPLAGVGNYLALLDREGDRPDRRREHLEMVRHGFDRIRVLARDLLAVAHPPSPRREPVELGGVLDRVERVVRTDRGFGGIVWRRRLPPDLPPLAADPFALEQVFLNLALNARDAMGETGEIRVEASSPAGDGRAIEIRFEDTGPGVPAALRERIFEPFFSTRGGTGLGLSVSASIVRGHGGSIRVEGGSGGGARFVLLLPAADAGGGPRA